MLTQRSARVVAAVKLHRQPARRRAGRFLAEGANLVEAAARRGLVCEIFVTEEAARRHVELLAGVEFLGSTVHTVTERAAKALSDTVTPAGLVAVCRNQETALADVLAGPPGLLAVGVGIAEPGNVGTIIRIADAMGAAGVILTGHGADPYNGKCLRASAGSIFTVPVVDLPDADPVTVLADLREAQVQTLATRLDGELSLDDADAVLARPSAWVFGPEAHGLPDAVAAVADHRVHIPLSGGAESLNVAAAAAVCLYQSARVTRAGEPEPGS